MAYVWQDSPVFLEHEGVKIYYIFKNDAEDSGSRTYWYGLTPYCSDEGCDNGEFDVRELQTWRRLSGWNMTETELIELVIRQAIDNGEIKPWIEIKPWTVDEEEARDD